MLLYTVCIISKPLVNSSWSYSPETTNLGQNRCFKPCATLKADKTALLCYTKLCISFHSHRLIQTGVTVQKHTIRDEINYHLSCEILKFDRWLSKTIGHLFYATQSFVYRSIAICEFRLKLQPGNTQFGSKSAILFVARDLEFWRMTLKKQQGTSSMLL